jgi:hypothetical protein
MMPPGNVPGAEAVPDPSPNPLAAPPEPAPMPVRSRAALPNALDVVVLLVRCVVPVVPATRPARLAAWRCRCPLHARVGLRRRARSSWKSPPVIVSYFAE